MTWLSDFAFFPRRAFTKAKDYLDFVSEFALPENWGPELRYLERYIEDNFQASLAQGLVQQPPDGAYALWRVGNLVTKDNEPISILCTKNRQTNKQPFYFSRIFNSTRFDILLDGKKLPAAAPDSPSFQVPPYHDDFKLTYRFDHYLKDNKSRAEEFLPTLNDHQRFLCIYAAATLAHKRGKQAAVAQWYRDKNAAAGSIQWLLPLFINQDDISKKPDLVATLDPDDVYKEYCVRTLLPPEWAYPHARSLSGHDPQFRTWA